MSSIALMIKTPKGIRAGKDDQLSAVQNLLQGVVNGSQRGSVIVQTSGDDPVAASATLTLTSAVATDAVTIGTETLTASSSPATEDDWEIDGADDDADAASLAAAINAHSVLSKIVLATSAANVVTVTSKVRGAIGNQIPISSADATIVASASYLAGGEGGAESDPKLYAR